MEMANATFISSQIIWLMKTYLIPKEKLQIAFQSPSPTANEMDTITWCF